MKAKKPETIAAILAAVLIAYTVIALAVLNTKPKKNFKQTPEPCQNMECAPRDLPSQSGTPRVLTTIEAVVTACTKNDPGMDRKRITSTGTKARPGVAAVDPKVIPLGSVLFVPGYGYARAEDTGGAIKGNRIVYFDDRDEAVKWGRKRLRVEIVTDRLPHSDSVNTSKN